jgi:hypothetical protein
MRVRFGGKWIADSEHVLLLFEPGRYPMAYFPETDVSRCSKRSVPAVYLTSVNSQFLSFSSFNEINMLRVISQGQNSDSLRLHKASA